MISDRDIVFVTTTLYTKWLNYQSKIIKNLFPNSQHIIVDGRENWPKSWFHWIDEIKKCDEKYYIHIDEDFFITNKDEVLKVIDKMESNNIDLIGCSDGYHHFRAANGVAINTFFMCGRISDIKKINIDLKSLEYQLGTYDGKNYIWLNNANLKFKEEYKNGFEYNHKKFADSNFKSEQEPYYAFLWLMKDLGCKFDYLYPHFDERFKSTNPRITEDSEDIGIHMWYIRQWNSSMDVWGLSNIERYNRIEKKLININEK